MDLDQAHRLLWILAALSFGVAILGLVGELLGWWNDIGEILMGLGTLAGIGLTGSAIAVGAGRDQVARVRTGVDAANGRLVSMDTKLDKLDTVDSKLDKLDTMDGKLGKLDELDVIQAELDRQTGVLERQVEILIGIQNSL